MVALNSYSSSMYEGKEITLYCDPEHPGKSRSKGLQSIHGGCGSHGKKNCGLYMIKNMKKKEGEIFA